VLFAPQHRTIDDALASYERTMLERVRGAIAEATADHLIAATGPGPLLADYGGETIWARPRRFEPFD
jgi:ribosomal protein S10